MRLIAAIPNYNGSHNLPHILHAVHQEEFDEVYLLDDASTDDSLEVLEKMETSTVVVKGSKNLGPGGNRNRIIPYLQPNDIVFFIDVDMELLSSGFRSKVLNMFEQEDRLALAGGLIYDLNNRPMRFNYGHFASLLKDFVGGLIEWLSLALVISFLRRLLMPVARPFTYNLDIRYGVPKKQPVDWTSEACFFIRGDLFKKLEGFDESFRYHEGQDLAQRIWHKEFEVHFWPEIHVRHLKFNVRKHRNVDIIHSWFKLKKY